MSNQDVLNDFYRAIQSSHESPRIYYQQTDSGLKIVIIVRDISSPLEDKIYKAEWKMATKYPKIKIQVRVLPKLNYPISTLLPEGFKRYSATS